MKFQKIFPITVCAFVCTMQLRYEFQISELEQQLEQKQHVEAAGSAAETKQWMSQVQTLEEELQQVKETHQEKEKSLHNQVESLQQQLTNKVGTGATKIFKLQKPNSTFALVLQQLQHAITG